MVANRSNPMEMQSVIQAVPVPASNAGTVLNGVFGRATVRWEALLFTWAENLSADYAGGLWAFKTLSNGGLYGFPHGDGPFNVEVQTNGYVGSMSADAFGIVASLFSLCHLTEMTLSDEFFDLYHKLRDFAAEHAERREIFKAID